MTVTHDIALRRILFNIISDVLEKYSDYRRDVHNEKCFKARAFAEAFDHAVLELEKLVLDIAKTQHLDVMDY